MWILRNEGEIYKTSKNIFGRHTWQRKPPFEMWLLSFYTSMNVIYRILGRRQGLLVGVGDVRVEVPLCDRGFVRQLGILLVVFALNKITFRDILTHNLTQDILTTRLPG